jgi:hypothetical protein
MFIADDPSSTGGGTTLSLTPWSSRAAPIVMNVLENQITTIVGKGTRFEFVVRDSASRRRTLSELQSICGAVVAGHVSEVVFERKNQETYLVGYVRLGDRTIKSSSGGLMARLLGRKMTIDYESYWEE